MSSLCDVERSSRCPVAAPRAADDQGPMHADDQGPMPVDDQGPMLLDDLRVCERIVVMFVQLKNYLGTCWLAPWFFVYIYPSILVYEFHGFVGSFVYCNIIQILFVVVFEFWDDSFNWTPLHDTMKSYFLQIPGRQHITKSVDELILFCMWVVSWAAVPTICLINGCIFELPIDRIERLSSYLSMMTVTFITAYIIILLWIDMNLLEVRPNVHNDNEDAEVIPDSELVGDDSMEPDHIPDLETAYEDISITNEFKLDNVSLEFPEVANENTIEKIKRETFCYTTKVEQGEEAIEQEMDVISLSSSTLSDFDVITEEEINLLD